MSDVSSRRTIQDYPNISIAEKLCKLGQPEDVLRTFFATAVFPRNFQLLNNINTNVVPSESGNNSNNSNSNNSNNSSNNSISNSNSNNNSNSNSNNSNNSNDNETMSKSISNGSCKPHREISRQGTRKL